MWTSSHSHSSSPSPHCSSNFTNNNNTPILGNNTNNDQMFPKSMEDIWRDISRGGAIEIHDLQASTGRVILQDFFSRDAVSPPLNNRSTTPTPPPVMLTLRSSFLQDNTTTATTTNGHIHDVPIPHCNNKGFIAAANQPADYDKNRRHKRMIKNRESAARSRARKQAYTTELELEVAHLMEENARLKKQQQQLYAAAAAQQRKNHKSSSVSLYRTSSAPI